MEITKSYYLKTAMFEKDFPTDGLPEIALTGRSNVGKSSFINAICHNSKLARTSKTPGKTITLNFYSVNDSFYFTDMPGYGYAARKQDTLKGFSKATDTYVSKRKELKGFISLIDSRVVTNDDIETIEYLKDRGVNFIIILSKIDKLKRNDILKRVNETAKTLGIEKDRIVTYSSLTHQNEDKVLMKLETLLKKEND